MTYSKFNLLKVSFRLSPKVTLASHTITTMTFLAASSAPTPLYRLYQDIWHFSPSTLTLIFAVYAFTLLSSLLVMGALSDYIGRRPVIILAIILEIISMLLFLNASNIMMLFTARAIQGFATGLAVSAIGAALLDLSKKNGALINGISPMLGMAIGVLLACTILQFSSIPLKLIFEVLYCLLILELLMVFLAPETAQKRQGAINSLKPHLAVPTQAKNTLLSITPINIAVWMVSGFYLSLMPSLLAKTFQTQSVWLSGMSFIALTLAGAVGILMVRNLHPARILLTGTISLMLGAVILLLGINSANVTLLFIGSLITGLGFGTGFLGSLRSLMPLALPEQRAGLMAAFFVESYLAFSIPAIFAGYFINKIGLISTANIYVILIIVLAFLALSLNYRKLKK
ncbi:MFS transporter [Acinetobacter sp. ANC 4648]|uniref:MFS transporter n=1 Tax=Acinetobacter sp. ANC 4648 TaxID=1977875 RepID=UPI001BB465EC|nr:MFS transporter [Acinetobacter sp. ANC 4648]